MPGSHRGGTGGSRSPWHSPVVVPVAEGTDRNGKGCPDGVQGVPHHLRLVANGETGDKGQGRGRGGHCPIPTPPDLSPPGRTEDFWTPLQCQPMGTEGCPGGCEGHCGFFLGGFCSRPVFVAAVEDHEGVGFSKEILLIQFVGAELERGHVLGVQSGVTTCTPSLGWAGGGSCSVRKRRDPGQEWGQTAPTLTFGV